MKPPALKSVFASAKEITATFFVRRIDPHIRDEQVQQFVIVEVEKDCAGGMTIRQGRETGFLGDVLELPLAQIPEQKISLQIDVKEELSPDFIIATSIQYPPTNYEYMLQVVVKSWYVFR